MPRTFTAASSEKVDLSLGAGASLSGAVTIAAIAKCASDGVSFYMLSVGQTARWALGKDTNNRVNINNATNAPHGTTTITAAKGWCCVVYSRASGTVTGRFHVYQYSNGTWTHTNASASNVNATPNTSSNIGSVAAAAYWNGDIAVAGAWAANFTDAQCELLAYDLSAWWQIQPAVLWILDQATTSQKVVDLTGGGANETSLVGTSVATSAVPVFSYGHEPLVVHAEAAAAPTGNLVTTGELRLHARAP